MTAEKVTLEIDLDDAEHMLDVFPNRAHCPICAAVGAYLELEVAKIHRRLEREQAGEPA